MSATLFMESTEITPEKSISEIEEILIRYGATAVLKEYESGVITAVSFRIKVGDNEVPFRLPCRWQAICQVLRKRAKIGDVAWTHASPYYVGRRQIIEQKAKRVAWRQILRWVAAQMALVETNMVKVEEVFFPYISAPNGQTLYEVQAGKHFGLLEGPK